MEASLIRYEAARQALAEAHRVDEVKDIRDKAAAMQIYAKQAKDTELIEHATEIRLRAERRLGEMMIEQPKAKGGTEPGVGRRGNAGLQETRIDAPITLAQAGIDKNLAHRARKAAALSEEQFEEKISRAKQAAVAAVEKKTRSGKTGSGRKSAREPLPDDPLAEADDALRDFDIAAATFLARARPVIEAISAIEITRNMGADAAMNLFHKVMRIRAVAFALAIGTSGAYEIQTLAEVTLGHLLIETERTGLRVPAQAKKGTRVGAETGFTLDDVGIGRKLSAECQELAGKPKRLSQKRKTALAPDKVDDADGEPSPPTQPIEETPIEMGSQEIGLV
jgi:hypothetical protein